LRGIALIWMAGVLFLLLRGIVGGRICRRIVARSDPFDEGRFAAELALLRGALGISTILRVVVSAEVGGPMVMGIVRPCIILPAGNLPWMSPLQVVQVLLHESAHVIRRDPLVNLLQNVVRALFWPQPLVHWLNVRLSQAREEVCDNFVLAHCEPADYAETLLQMTERSSTRLVLAGGLPMLAERGSLEQRVTGLLDATRDLSTHWPRARRWAIHLTLLLIPVLLGLVRVTTRDAQSAEPATTSAAAAENPRNAATDSSPNAAQGTGKIIGRVVRDRDETFVAGARVILVLPLPSGREDHVWPLPHRRTTTDAHGNYAFDGLAPGRYQIWGEFEQLTSRRETARGSRVVVPEKGDGPQPVSLRLGPGVALKVRVTERQTGKPIAGAIAHLGSGDPRQSNFGTDRDGRVTVQPLGSGPWYVEVWAEHFARQRKWLNLGGGGDAEVEFALAPGGEIDGMIRDPSGKPLAGAEMSVGQEGESQILLFAYTDADGRYRLPHLPVDVPLHISLWKADFCPLHIPAKATATRQSREFVLQPRADGGSIVGTVVDEQGQPIADALVQNKGRSPNGKDEDDDDVPASELRETRTGPDGRFRLDNLYHLRSETTLLVAAKGFVRQRVDVDSDSSDKAAEQQIKMQTGHRLRGRVTDDTGRPLPGVAVSVGEANLARYRRIGSTGPDGGFDFDSLPSGPRLAFSKPGYAPIENLKLEADINDAVAISLVPAGVILGKVTMAPTGAPLPAFRLRIDLAPQADGARDLSQRLPRNSRFGEEFRSADGRFALEELADGKMYVITVNGEGYSPETTAPMRAARREAAKEMEIKLEPVDPASLVNYRGRLLDPNRKPVPGAQLRLIAARDRKASPGRYAFPYAWWLIRTGQVEHLEQDKLLRFVKATTDQEGRFEFTRIPRQAEVELVWWGDGIAPGRADHLDQRLTDAGEKAIELVLPRPARITGRIDRRAFPGAAIVTVLAEDGATDSATPTEELKPGQETFTIDGLAPGKYVVSLKGEPGPLGAPRKSERPIASRNITLTEGQAVAVEFDQK
jgi:beta-lactamase regulating signal transducer with metallopeptidase domain/protocatechuate 3,4-dioxygenase beta subunit